MWCEIIGATFIVVVAIWIILKLFKRSSSSTPTTPPTPIPPPQPSLYIYQPMIVHPQGRNASDVTAAQRTRINLMLQRAQGYVLRELGKTIHIQRTIPEITMNVPDPPDDAYKRDNVEKALNLPQSNTIYIVFYDGQGPACAQSYAPTEYGKSHMLIVPLDNAYTYSCDWSNNTWMSYIDYALAHEIVHSMGFVPLGAPRSGLNGHIIDEPSDLMYAGPHIWNYATGLHIDPNNTSYRGLLLESPYLS